MNSPLTVDTRFTFLCPEDLDRIDIDEVVKVALDSLNPGYYQCFVNACIHTRDSLNVSYGVAIEAIKKIIKHNDYIISDVSVYAITHEVLDRSLSWAEIDEEEWSDIEFRIQDIADEVNDEFLERLYTDSIYLELEYFIAVLKGKVSAESKMYSALEIRDFYNGHLSMEECEKLAVKLNPLQKA
jgi:hypothetical protein